MLVHLSLSKMAESQQSTGDIVKNTITKPHIIMKIDAPVEDADKTECEKNETETLKICTPTTTFRTTNSFGNSSFNKFGKGILKPPQLSLNNSSSTSSKPFVLNPSRLNPFISKTESKNDHSEKKQLNGDTVKFVPLIQTDQTDINKSNTPSSSVDSTKTPSKNFVFGVNIQDRVIGETKSEEPSTSSSVSTSSNGNTELLFSTVMKNEVDNQPDSTTIESKSLMESAREYEESRANKRKYEEVELKTGEEEENNIVRMSCKLFSYDKAGGSWQERGRGTLRLNDLEFEENQTQSRLVFRTSGSLRVILNTKIWAEMTVEQASEKSTRITALDSNGEIKVFLIMGNIEDSKILYQHLHSRVEKEIAAQKRRKLNAEPDSGGQ